VDDATPINFDASSCLAPAAHLIVEWALLDGLRDAQNGGVGPVLAPPRGLVGLGMRLIEPAWANLDTSMRNL
jgi:hypothetical protein